MHSLRVLDPSSHEAHTHGKGTGSSLAVYATVEGQASELRSGVWVAVDQ